MISMDGFDSAPGGDLPWPTIDDEFHQFAVEQLDRAGLLVFGRETYSAMAEFWPSAEGAEAHFETARRMNALPKVVCSRTLKDATWAPSRVVGEDTAAALAGLKGVTQGDLLLLGSATLLASLLASGVVDELRLMVAPVLLGQGRSALAALPQRAALRLHAVRPFASGNVLLTYRPAHEE